MRESKKPNFCKPIALGSNVYKTAQKNWLSLLIQLLSDCGICCLATARMIGAGWDEGKSFPTKIRVQENECQPRMNTNEHESLFLVLTIRLFSIHTAAIREYSCSFVAEILSANQRIIANAQWSMADRIGFDLIIGGWNWFRVIKTGLAIRLVQQFDDVLNAAIGVEHSGADAQLHLASGIGRDQNLGLRGFHFADLVREQALGHFSLAQVVDARAAAAILHSLELPVFETWNRAQDLLRRGHHALGVIEVAGRVVSNAAVDFSATANSAPGQKLSYIADARAEAFRAFGVLRVVF